MLHKISVQSEDGTWIQIVAFDRQVHHPDFVIGNRLYLFYLSAAAGFNNRAFYLWSDAHIICAHKECMIVPLTEQIILM